MKTQALVLLFALSSLNASADLRLGDNPTSGQGPLTVSGIASSLNLRIDGPAAKVLFDNMTDARETNERLGSLLLTHRESAQLRCTFSAEVAMTYGCLLNLDAAGIVNAGAAPMPHDGRVQSVSGTVSAAGERGTINVSFDGEAGKLVYDTLTRAQETTRRIGSLLLTSRGSSDILATFSAEVAASYEATFHVDTQGNVLADNVVWTM